LLKFHRHVFLHFKERIEGSLSLVNMERLIEAFDLNPSLLIWELFPKLGRKMIFRHKLLYFGEI